MTVSAWLRGMLLVSLGCGRAGFDGRVAVDAGSSATADAGARADAAAPDASVRACTTSGGYAPIAGAPGRYALLGAATFADGQAACAADGAHLVDLADRAEATAVFAALPDDYVWVGASDAAVEGTFISVLGDDVTTRYAVSGAAIEHATWWWNPASQPDNSGNCLSFIRVGLDPGAHLDDAGCDGLRRTLCECE